MPQYTPESDLQIVMKGSAGGANNNNIRIWSASITPTQAMGYVVNYTTAGFTTVTNIDILVMRATTDPMQVPNVALDSFNTTQCKVNITQGNNATVVILGINVLSGGPIVAATNLNTITLLVRVEGT